MNLFTIPPIDYSLRKYKMTMYTPVSVGINPSEIVIPALDDYVDLNRSYFEFELRLNTAATNPGITADDDTKSTAGASKYIYQVNNLAHSILKNIGVKLNGHQLNNDSNLYPYQAFFQTLLNYDRTEGETLLAPQGWVNQLDVPPEMEATGGGDDDRPTTEGLKHTDAFALKTATTKFVENKKVTLQIRPYVPSFHTGKLLVPGVEIGLQLYFQNPNFFLFGTKQGGGGPKKYVTLTTDDIKITFHLCRVALNPSLYDSLATERAGDKKWVKYLTVGSQIRTYTFPDNTTRFEKSNIFPGKVLDRMIVGLVRSEAFNGELNFYPFSFQKFGITRIRQIIGGEETPYTTLELNGGDDARDFSGYHRMLQAMGKTFKGGASMIKPEEWGQGKNCTLFFWNNVASGDADSPNRNQMLAGDVKLEIEFNAAVNQNLTVVVFGEFEHVLEVDNHGGIVYKN